MVIAFVLFFAAGLGFGYAAPRALKWIPLLFPTLLALGAFVRAGVDGEVLGRFVAALAVTAVGIVLGWFIDERSARRPSRAA